MTEEEFTYKDLRKIHQLEKKSSTLIPIDSKLYGKAKEYIKRLEDSLEGKQEYKKKLLLDEIKNSRQILMEIYEYREKKIVLAALSKIRGGDPDIRNMLEKEKELFDELIEILTKRRKNLFSNPTNTPTEKRSNQLKRNNTIVLIKKDIPTFIGTDMKRYRLRKNDVISLPDEIYDTLKKRGVLETVKMKNSR